MIYRASGRADERGLVTTAAVDGGSAPSSLSSFDMAFHARERGVTSYQWKVASAMGVGVEARGPALGFVTTVTAGAELTRVYIAVATLA